MEVLVFLVPLALMLGLLGLVGFLWSLRNGQYDDLEGAGWRAIADDDPIREIQHPEHQFGSFAHALQALAEAKPHSPAVAQTVGFGIGKSNILYLSMGID